MNRDSTDDKLKFATEEWWKEQWERFYFTGVEKLRDRYKLCSDRDGDYVEKIIVFSSIYLLFKQSRLKTFWPSLVY